MSELAKVQGLTQEKMSASIVDASTIAFTGSISLRVPAEVLRPFFADVHAAAVADELEELAVDFVNLEFMNSSSIRVLVTWLDWIAAEPEPKQYVLHFKTKSGVTWQRTTLSVLQTLSQKHVKISSVDG